MLITILSSSGVDSFAVLEPKILPTLLEKADIKQLVGCDLASQKVAKKSQIYFFRPENGFRVFRNSDPCCKFEKLVIKLSGQFLQCTNLGKTILCFLNRRTVL